MLPKWLLVPLITLALATGFFSATTAAQSPPLGIVARIATTTAPATHLGSMVMAQSIGDNHEPLGITDTFYATAPVIYLVTEAPYIRQGTTFFARWVRDGTLVMDNPLLIVERDHTDTYVAFHMLPHYGRMHEGFYTVQLLVNGSAVGRASFYVVPSP